MKSKRSNPSSGATEVAKSSRIWPRVLLAVLGGTVAAIGWLPPHSAALVVVGIAAILHAGREAASFKKLVLICLAGSVAFFAICNRPLVSAYGWGGWATDGGPAVGSSGWWLLNCLWVLISVWCALFWTAAFTLAAKLRPGHSWTRVLFFATAWVCLAEWLRSVCHWGFEWGFLGFALADSDTLRQWSSVGGVFLISWLLVAASALLVELLTTAPENRLVLGASAFAAGLLVWLGGVALEQRVDSGAASLKVAAFQFAPPVPAAGTTSLGLSSDWSAALKEVVSRDYRLIVLPESISSQAVQLDGVAAAELGTNRQVHADLWRVAMAGWLREFDTFVALGVEGIEQGATYNSTSIWSRQGLAGWQHKVHLVPFAEYLPRGWGFLGRRGLTYYQAGEQYRPIEAGPFRIGSFICQEIQHAGTARELTRRGANILVTGGNDGVFADRKVALVHHSMARVRATEVGRFVVRAMKTGVTSVVSPSGEVIGSSPAEGPALIAATVSLTSGHTIWTRVGMWPYALGALGFGVALLRSSRHKA